MGKRTAATIKLLPLKDLLRTSANARPKKNCIVMVDATNMNVFVIAIRNLESLKRIVQ